MRATDFSVSLLIALAALCWRCDSSPHWDVEERAKPTVSHPLAGFWKPGRCSPEKAWGLAIGPVGPETYYVSFCGPSGCFAEGRYRPETKLYGDPEYKVLSENEVEIKGQSGFTKYVRCPDRRGDAQPRSEYAAFAAAAGIEIGRDELARVCGNLDALVALRRSASDNFVPLPGYEGPVSEILGHRLPGGATMTITLRVSEASPSAFVLRSLGHSPVEDKTLDATMTCEQAQAKRPQ
jgi:hypothetical protein